MKICACCKEEYNEEEAYFVNTGICDECQECIWDTDDYEYYAHRDKEEEESC